MTEPLDDFRIAPKVYRLGQYSPVSIRDQIVRANYLIEHLRGTAELSHGTRVLVIGAGVAGLTTAVAANTLGADVTLVDVAGAPMSLQAKSSSRWLDPVQYDWPAPYWLEEAWPVSESARPRRFTSVAISYRPLTAALAEDWAISFQNRTSAILGTSVRTIYYVMASMWRASGAEYEVDLTHMASGAVQTVKADLVIVAAGFGIERSSVPNATAGEPEFQGIDFWSTDKFEDADMGIPALANGVLVSGAGDGALQDFIRLSTGQKSARDILYEVWNRTSERALFKEKLNGLWHWEDNAARSKRLIPKPLSECEILTRLHQRHEDAIDALVNSPDWVAVRNWLSDITRSRRSGAVTLAHKCEHFSWCYPLNRTVALLVARFYAERGRPVLRPRTSLLSTSGDGHACSAGCWGKTHKVHLAGNVTCSRTGAMATTEQFDGLVIRHGIAPLDYGTPPFLPLTQQAVPYHLP